MTLQEIIDYIQASSPGEREELLEAIRKRLREDE
jgi:hypothetical protein